MAKIAVVIDDLFEYVGYPEPVGAYKEAGHDLISVELKAGAEVKDIKRGTPVTIGKDFNDVEVGDFHSLLIQGGYSPDRLRAHKKPVRFTADFPNSGKPVFTICHAPQLFITADVPANRKVTGYKSIIQDIKNAGADSLDKVAVEDGNLISSRGPKDIPAFIRAKLKWLS